MSNTIVVQGASRVSDVPGLDQIAPDVTLRFATDDQTLANALPGADVLLGWQFADSQLESVWHKATDLRWIQWCGAGVDALLFDALVKSDVVVTNMRGLFDRAMAEYTLGLILNFAKDFKQTFDFERRRYWQYRETEMIAGQRVLVVGPGSIGRQIARVLDVMSMRVSVVGRTAREDDEFGRIHAIAQLPELLPQADYVVLIMPDTQATCGLFGAELIACMQPTARLINLGRGSVIDEAALVDALVSERLGGAALDVFRDEPLPVAHPFWEIDSVQVSPHMSGDYKGYKADMVTLFLHNLTCYQQGAPLQNLVNKTLGFVGQGASPKVPGAQG